MACDHVQGGGWERIRAGGMAETRRNGPARFRNGPGENQAAEKLPMPG
jgi:hypothetical protein